MHTRLDDRQRHGLQHHHGLCEHFGHDVTQRVDVSAAAVGRVVVAAYGYVRGDFFSNAAYMQTGYFIIYSCRYDCCSFRMSFDALGISFLWN